MGNPGSSDCDPTTSHLDPLHKTIESLGEIRAALLPFLRLLGEDSSSSSSSLGRHHRGHQKKKRSNTHESSSSPAPPEKKKRGRPLGDDDRDDDCGVDGTPPARRLDPRRRAEAEAAVALAVGTLRYMGARLRGSDAGRKKGDPLRAELDRMRAALVSLRQLEGATRGGGDADDDGAPGVEGGTAGPSKKKQKDGRINGETARGDDGGK